MRDDVSMNLAIADDVENVKADIYLMTHTTNPLISCDTITNALERFKHQVASELPTRYSL